MAAAPLSSILLGTTDPTRLRAWYGDAFGADPDDNGILVFGGFGVVIEHRADVADKNPEPGRVILNFHVDDARAVAAHLDTIGVTWLVEVEERPAGLFGTLVDPDGNYVQIIQFT